MNLMELVETTRYDAARIAEQTSRIQAAALSHSKYLDSVNFTRIHPADLRFLFDQYDAAFFGGQFKEALGDTPLEFSFSKRLTRSGGMTYCTVNRRTGERRFEVCMSLAILWGCFNSDDHREMTANGLLCHNRLDALQRVFEHEIVHVVETLLWGISKCSQDRFASIVNRFFGHTDTTHQLITPFERAVVKYGVMPGVTVRFQFEGRELTGRVARVQRRATVLVEDARGLPYNDGKRYAKYYIQLPMLEVLNPPAPR